MYQRVQLTQKIVFITSLCRDARKSFDLFLFDVLIGFREDAIVLCSEGLCCLFPMCRFACVCVCGGLLKCPRLSTLPSVSFLCRPDLGASSAKPGLMQGTVEEVNAGQRSAILSLSAWPCASFQGSFFQRAPFQSAAD